MLTAMSDKGRRFTITKSHQASDLKKWREESQFYCEACGRPLTLKIGEQVSWHFAHKPNTKCVGEHEPESLAHLEGKKVLFSWLKKQGLSPIMEQYLPKIRQRADIFIPQISPSVAIEYQCSSLPPERFMERNQGYDQLQIQPIWILGENRLKRVGSHTYKWMQTEHLMTFHTGGKQKPYAIFFDGRKERFTFLYDFWSISPSLMIAEHEIVPASKLAMQHLFHPHLLSSHTELKETAWLHHKEKWRTARSPYPSRLERYIRKICQHLGLHFECFPAFIGLPIPNDLTIASPTYLWQAWLVLQFLYSRPVGTMINTKTIIKSFAYLMDENIVQIRGSGMQEAEIERPILHYLTILERFSYIGKCDNRNYVLKRKVEWVPKAFVQLRREDQATLYRWIELAV
ncbi:MAG: competence protein CoiA [Tuberibacillus sp.]